MVKDFKFLHIKKPLLTNTVLYMIKDGYNRNQSFYINWSQFPTTQQDDENTNYKEFNGNIFEFWNSMKRYDLRSGRDIITLTPTVYEIYFERRGYHSHSISYGNHHQLREFISRGWKLKIIYTFD
jgi:N-acyl-L-homoserine lactone synthetase